MSEKGSRDRKVTQGRGVHRLTWRMGAGPRGLANWIKRVCDVGMFVRRTV